MDKLLFTIMILSKFDFCDIGERGRDVVSQNYL